jgi:tRNA(fMet)-specific endonuclease VapC
VIPCDATTARHYARLRNRLRGKGRPIPENDLWIAATAIEHGLVLVSRDEHFAQVEGLLVESW